MNFKSIPVVIRIFPLLLAFMANPLAAATFGKFTYTVSGGNVTITGYPENASGAVDIPAVIAGKPVTSIGSDAFEDCKSLTDINIPASVTTIETFAFHYCVSITRMTIPASVTTLKRSAFNHCLALEDIDVDGDNPNYSSKKGVLYNKDKSALICYPEGKAGPFSIPESVTSIEKHAFSRSLSLTSLTIPNSVNFIGKYAFSNCHLLTSLTIPNGVAEIKRNTFFNCTALTSVSLPDSITSIGARAFYKCKSLPSLTLSAGVTSIEQDALYDCSSLTEILVDGANPNYSSAKGLLLNKSGTLMILCPAGKSGNFTLPASVTTIGHHAFYNCALLTGVTLPDGVKTIKEYAFYLCTTLANVTLPDSLTSIERDAFDNCTLLANITIPDSVTSIKRGTFSYCSSLTHITLPKSITSIDYAAFYYCIALKKATFLGDAPVLEIDVFTGAHAQFKVYFTEGSAGFTTPTWNGYPSVAVPENSGLTVRQAVGNGTAKKSFGTVVVGQTGPARSITIANPGNTALTGLAITLGGDQPQDFIVTSPLGKSLAAGASATFKVSFKPTAAGTRRATLQIKAKGNLRSLTEIKLVGLGVNP